jgi:hypothetical protein
MEFFELYFGRVRKLCQNSVNPGRESILESLWCISIPAYRYTRDITLKWVIYQS